MGASGDSAAIADRIRRDWARGRPVLVPTSGTTGEARWVEHGPDSVEASCRAVSEVLAVDPHRDRWLACVPMRFVAGIAIVLRGEITGTPVTVHEGFDIGAVAQAAGECTLVSLVPTQLTRLLDAGAPLSRFRAVLLGGGPVPPGLLDRAATAGVALHTTYGLAETFGGCVHDGFPLRDVELRVAPASDDRSGEVLVRGPVLMRGYVDDPVATNAAFVGDPEFGDGWFRTGDVGAIDDAGRLRIVDRLKDLIISGGVNVSPTAVERVLTAHPAVADVCVIGEPDPEWGERVVACIVPAPGAGPPTLAELRAFAGERLEPAQIPKALRLVDEIPRTPSGKPRRAALR